MTHPIFEVRPTPASRDGIAMSSATQPLALYVHWPFCLSKCPYCDFNSHVQRDLSGTAMAEGLLQELGASAAHLDSRHLTSIFFGGGTPSLMQPRDVACIIETAIKLFPPKRDVEITLEANPTSVEQSRLDEFRDAGVNRLSLGVQSLDDTALQWLGREHSASEAVEALEVARSLFERISFDLIYARPQQTRESWSAELSQALALVSDHLSLYQLTIEPGTQFEAAHRKGLIKMLDDSLAVELYDMTANIAAQHGLEGYEISNYARIGSESRHNLSYWRYEDYLGIGPGAHSRLTSHDAAGIMAKNAVRRHRAPAIWLQKVQKYGVGTVEDVSLSAEDRAREALLMGLRLRDGIDRSQFRETTAQELDACLDQRILEASLAEGYLTYSAGRLAATRSGRIRLEALLAALVL